LGNYLLKKGDIFSLLLLFFCVHTAPAVMSEQNVAA